MQKQSLNNSLEQINLMKKRVEFLIGGRIYDRKKMAEASCNIDKLRRKVSGLSSTEIIRKFRGKI